MRNRVLTLAGGILVLFVVGYIFSDKQAEISSQPTPTLTTSPTTTGTPTPFPRLTIPVTTEWKTFSVPELGLVLKHPSLFQNVTSGIIFDYTNVREEDQSYPGALAGKKLGGSLSLQKCLNSEPCDSYGISFGALTNDFAAPRGGSIEDTFGYIKENGVYYYRSPSGQKSSQIPYTVIEFKTPNTSGILLRGRVQEPVPGALLEDSRLAIFNLKSSEFSSVAFFNYDVSRLSEDDFLKILETVQIQ